MDVSPSEIRLSSAVIFALVMRPWIQIFIFKKHVWNMNVPAIVLSLRSFILILSLLDKRLTGNDQFLQ